MPDIDNAGIQIHYEVIGEGEPIVLLHGNGNSIADWYDCGFIDVLQNKYQLILIDARGYGDSSKPHDIQDYSPQKIASDVILVLDDLKIKQAYCFGYSMGGRHAFAVMKYYPERIKTFIIGGMNPYGQSSLKNLIAEWLKKGLPYFVEQFEKEFGRFPEKIRPRYLANDTQAMLASSSYVWPDMSEDLKKITVPCFLYGGECDDVTCEIKKYGQLIRKGEYRILKGMDHCQPFWSGLSAQLIDEFLTKVKRGDYEK